MKGFGIYVKNNLLEPKHVENMGESIWLYLWLLDKMTSVNESGVGKVLNNKPLTYEIICSDLGVRRQVYVRWIKKLRDAGYIRTTRTPKGLCLVVNKAEKIFGNRSIKTDTSDVSKVIHREPSDVSKTIPQMRQNRASNIRQYNNNTLEHSTNVLDPTGLPPKPNYGKPEINELFEYWSQEVMYDLESRVTANRRAASNLLKKYGKERLHQLIRGVFMAQGDQYAPRIADFCDLQSKTHQLIAWGRTKGHEAESVVRI